nr:hypothetical protein CFP56_57046 [Quercus suber]
MKFSISILALGVASLAPLTSAWTVKFYGNPNPTACAGTPIKTVTGTTKQCLVPPSGAVYLVATFDAAGGGNEYKDTACTQPTIGNGLVSGSCAYALTQSYVGIQD